MPDDLILDDRHRIPGDELLVTAARASGPGGQHVNTTDTRVRVRWDVAATRALAPDEKARVLGRLAARLTRDGALLVTSDAHRSQRRNRDAALRRLAELVRWALRRETPRRPTTVPAAVREGRLRQKRLRAAIKRARRGGGDDEP